MVERSGGWRRAPCLRLVLRTRCGPGGGRGGHLVLNCVSCSHHLALLPVPLAHRKQPLISPGSSAAFHTSLSLQLISSIVCAAVPDNRLCAPPDYGPSHLLWISAVPLAGALFENRDLVSIRSGGYA